MFNSESNWVILFHWRFCGNVAASFPWKDFPSWLDQDQKLRQNADASRIKEISVGPNKRKGP